MPIDINSHLTAHFQLWEFIQSQTGERLGIDNTPSDEIIKNITYLCETILEPARMALGPLVVSSGYRCEKLNMAIGGEKTSAHQFGFAADILPVSVSKIEFAKWVAKNCKFDQIILEYGTKMNPAWVHVSADTRLRRQIMQKLSGFAYQAITL